MDKDSKDLTLDDLHVAIGLITYLNENLRPSSSNLTPGPISLIDTNGETIGVIDYNHEWGVYVLQS